MKIKHLLKKISSVKKSILGASIIIGTFIICLLMPMGIIPFVKKVPILLTSIGTFIGTMIFSKGLQENAKLESETNVDEIINERTKLKKYHDLETELEKVKAEKVRLEGMKIQLRKLQPIMKLSLLECDLTMYDYKDEIMAIKDSSLNFINSKETTTNYVGLMCKNFKASLGIDLHKVRITEINNSLIVSGIKCEYQGMLDTKTEWKMHEIRKRVFKNDQQISESIIMGDSRISDCMVEQERQLNQRISNGMDIHANEPVVILFAEKFISMILEPLNKNITFENDFSKTASLPLIDFINKKNEIINIQLLEEEKKQKMIIASQENNINSKLEKETAEL